MGGESTRAVYDRETLLEMFGWQEDGEGKKRDGNTSRRIFSLLERGIPVGLKNLIFFNLKSHLCELPKIKKEGDLDTETGLEKH